MHWLQSAAARADIPGIDALALPFNTPPAEGWEQASRASNLTPREHQVLQLVAKGLTNKEIGRAFGISDNTARNHVNSIIEKLEVSDRTEAATIAMRQGLVSITE